MELISHVLSQIATHVKTLFTSSSWRHHGAVDGAIPAPTH